MICADVSITGLKEMTPVYYRRDSLQGYRDVIEDSEVMAKQNVLEFERERGNSKLEADAWTFFSPQRPFP